jgi:predicted AlkP superfamily pyrophosphatase or phosphodiesterase
LKRLPTIALAICLALATLAAQPTTRSPILLLVSLDGFRWDYLDRGVSPNLSALATRGVRAKDLIPSFPSLTYPNHYTIVTGLYPEHHGIIANDFVDPDWPEPFRMSSSSSHDSRWWGGEPLWVTVLRQGKHASALFWPGDESIIGGRRPDDWVPYDGTISNSDRVKRALEWLGRPERSRASFIPLYFSETDSAGHNYGPDSAEINEAIHHVDAAIGQLEAGLRDLRLLDRTTIVVVSDHGMQALSDDRVVFLDDFVDLSRIDVPEWGEVVQIRPRMNDDEEIRRALNVWPEAMRVYARSEMGVFHYRDNPRIAPLVALAGPGWEITSHEHWESDRARGRKRGGAHGYDPASMAMHGVFLAAGPRLKHNWRAPSMQNVHVYDFLCAVLGVTPAPNDGDPAVTRPFFSQ